MPRHFGRTVMVFRAIPAPVIDKMPGSSSCGLGSPPEFVVSASAFRHLRDQGAFLGVSFLFAASVQRVHSRRASRLTSVPPSAFRTLSTAFSSLYLAGVFRPAATSRILAPGFLPRPSCTTSSVAMSSRRWRRVSVAGCPTTPSHAASTSGPRSRSGSAAPPRGLAQVSARVPSRLSPSDSCCRPCPCDEQRLHP